jgi:flagellar biogenesis protein FliO
MRNLIKSGFLTAFLLLSVGSLYAQQQDSADSAQTENQNGIVDESDILLSPSDENRNSGGAGNNTASAAIGSGAGVILRPIFALTIVIALIYAVVYLLKRLSGRGTQRSSAVNVLGSQTLTSQTSLHIVEIDDRLYLLGTGESVTLLDIIDNKEHVDSIKLKIASQQEQSRGFAEMIGDKLKESGLEFSRPNMRKSIDEQKQRLNRLKESHKEEGEQ